MQKIELLFDEFNAFLHKENFYLEPKELYLPISYTLEMQGKRIRPIMALLCCDYFGGNYKDAMNTALGIELFHNFTLLHDDIMDDAPLRRGQKTVYKKWNPNIAILSGDTMFAMAYEYISKTKTKFLKKILEVFSQTAIKVCEGQQYDMNYEMEENVDIKDYLKMIHLKTAYFLGACLKIGAIIGNASQKDIENIHHFGENLGMAFQLQDDYLDVFGNEKTFGKKIGGDIISNKKTYLYLKAYDVAQGEDRKTLKQHFIKNHPDNNLKVQKIKELYLKLGINKITESEIQHYYKIATYHLKKINYSKNDKADLKLLAERLIKRNY